MSLLHWWTLDQTLKDKIGKLDLINYNQATFEMGKITPYAGKASKNGQGTEKNFYANNDLTTVKNLSISAWIKIDALKIISGWGSPVMSCCWDNDAWTDIRFGFEINYSTNQLYFNISDGTNYTYIMANTALERAKWYHIVGTYAYKKELRLYIDGSEAASPVATTVVPVPNIYYCIGGNRGDKSGFDGFINDVKIYNHCLSKREIRELSRGLFLHYTFEEDFTTTNKITDNSGYSNNGKSNNVTKSTDTRLGKYSGEFASTSSSYIIGPTNVSHITKGTICWWQKSSAIPTKLLLINGNNAGSSASSQYIAAGDEINLWKLYSYDVGEVYYWKDGVKDSTARASGEKSSTKYSNNNKWHFYCVVGINLENWNYFNISGYPNYYIDGNIADLKVYTTALSDEDIQDLYSTRVSLNSVGEIFTDYIEETDTNDINITKTGILKCKSIEETSTVSSVAFTKDAVVKCTGINGSKDYAWQQFEIFSPELYYDSTNGLQLEAASLAELKTIVTDLGYTLDDVEIGIGIRRHSHSHRSSKFDGGITTHYDVIAPSKYNYCLVHWNKYVYNNGFCYTYEFNSQKMVATKEYWHSIKQTDLQIQNAVNDSAPQTSSSYFYGMGGTLFHNTIMIGIVFRIKNIETRISSNCLWITTNRSSGTKTYKISDDWHYEY